MPAFLNVADFFKIGLLAFLFIFLANKMLDKVGLSQFKA